MQKLGRYQIHELIGQGAMAKVFKAFDPEINRTLAIKILQSELARSEDYRTRFLREAHGAGGLSHPNIVTVFDVGESDAQPYIAMELVDGESLSDVLRRKEPLPLKDVVEIGIQLARALDYAHKKGIVHRDVKPGNIMMIRGTCTIKVADFGICRIESGDATQHTRMGDVLGTPNYMSPEQVLGGKLDYRSDLFSAGVVLFQLLTGALPFEGETLVGVAMRIVKSDPVSIDKLRPDLPLSLRRIIDRALRKPPEKRFQSGEELAQALIAVAREISAQSNKKRRIPLSVRWATIMALLVAGTMSVTAFFVHQKQQQALVNQVIGYGGSLAKFMASQSAVPMLAEDWAATEAFIQSTVSNQQQFSYLVIEDHKGIVRGSSIPTPAGTRYVAPKGVAVVTRETGFTVERLHLKDQKKVLDFSAPILFQGKQIGAVHLGIFEAPLIAVTNLTMLLLGALIVVTSLAVAVFMYFLAQRLSTPIRIMKNSLKEISKGHYDYRIADARKDEFGELFAAFDEAAAAIQQRHDPNPDETRML